MLKTVSNEKEWTDFGWIYRMRRIVNGKHIAYHLAISKLEMHNRHVVAYKLRDARRQLAFAVDCTRRLMSPDEDWRDLLDFT